MAVHQMFPPNEWSSIFAYSFQQRCSLMLSIETQCKRLPTVSTYRKCFA